MEQTTFFGANLGAPRSRSRIAQRLTQSAADLAAHTRLLEETRDRLARNKRHGVKALGNRTAAMIAVSEAELVALIQAMTDGQGAIEEQIEALDASAS
jgi:hypothetical protein